MCLPPPCRKKPDEFGFDLFVGDEASCKLLDWKRRQLGQFCPARFLLALSDQQALMKFRHTLRGELRQIKIYRFASIRHLRLRAGSVERKQVGLKVEPHASEDLNGA